MPPLSRPVLRRRRAVIGLLVISLAAIAWLMFDNKHGLKHEWEWPSQGDDVAALMYTPDGQTLLSASGDSVRLWDPPTGALKSSLTTYDSAPGHLTVSSGGDLLACTRYRRVDRHSEEYTVETWDLRTGTRTGVIDLCASAIAFSRDGRMLATATATRGSRLQLWSLPALAPAGTASPRPAMVGSLCFSSDGKMLASAEADAIELLDLKTGMTTRTLRGPTGGLVAEVQFSPDGNTIAAVVHYPSPNHSGVWTWDVATGRPARRAEFEHPVRSTSFSADGSRLAILMTWSVFSRSDRVEVWNVTSGRKIGSITDKRFMSCVALSHDGRQVALGFQQPHPKTQGTIGVWGVR